MIFQWLVGLVSLALVHQEMFELTAPSKEPMTDRKFGLIGYAKN